MKKIFYKTEVEKDQIVSDEIGLGLFLIEDAITVDGNYLIFDVSPQSPIVIKVWNFEKLISVLKTKNMIKDTDL